VKSAATARVVVAATLSFSVREALTFHERSFVFGKRMLKGVTAIGHNRKQPAVECHFARDAGIRWWVQFVCTL